MKNKLFIIALLLAMVLSACTGSPNDTPTPVIESTRTLPNPVVSITRAPAPQTAAEGFLSAWKGEDYAGMYALLTSESQAAISAADFEALYRSTAMNLTLASLDYTLTPGPNSPVSAEMSYAVVFHTNLMGDMTRSMAMPLVNQAGQWRITWSDGMIMPELAGGNRLSLVLDVPERGSIYDRDGVPVAYKADAVSLGIQPGLIPENDENTMLSELSRLTGKTREAIKASYQGAAPDWYIPVGEALASAVAGREGYLSGLGVIINGFTSRYYPNQGTAPHVVGYVLSIGPDELESYRRAGFRQDELVGASGLEKWGEKYLMGTRGANLYVLDPQQQIVTRIVQSDARPAQDITTTLDANLQVAAQNAIKDYRGAVVVLERDSGRVLAMASSPTFNPNINSAGNWNQSSWVQKMFEADTQRLVNRAAQGGGYPLGSVFKIIDTAAVLENGLFTPKSTYDCQLTFTDLVGRTYYDWTFKKEFPPSGILTLPEGLMRSCNPWFYHIGLEMFNQGVIAKLTEMAKAFGLGSATGIDQVAESEGNVPLPANENEAVEFAIGQDKLLVTPLQVADFIAAVGNGGILYRPQVVEKIAAPDGAVSFTFAPEVRGRLPVSPENLKVIQDAMLTVTKNRRGTAYQVFGSMSIPVHGKTGTAELGGGSDSHAWFGAYTDANRKNQPDIAVAVIAENAGEGSEIAAPIARRIIEVYFFGKPQRLYPWESSFGVIKTETPTETLVGDVPAETPVP